MAGVSVESVQAALDDGLYTAVILLHKGFDAVKIGIGGAGTLS